ncbi:hypothetical protein N7495_007769 [Penicillium taxi]|uniref:uncharacterized protein n=1 Tax=Penicillium taxi TaxID=168475 RepID=UPI002545B58B|nr:uncharacterized protein N7495_007769 [Penicillium taxi]KAJ5887728.1 hypothetical protein N7495_007769 [Penicillium taxi]
MDTEPEHPRAILLKEMQTAAQLGNLTQLQSLLQRWETELINGIPAIEQDQLWFKPGVNEQLELFNELNRPKEETKWVHNGQLLMNRVLVSASRGNQVAVAEFLLEEKGCPITSIAVQVAMMKRSFDVLESYLSHGWDINQPIRNNQCPILRQVVNDEERVRWCLEHRANPNTRNNNKTLDVLSHAARHASFPVLELLVAHGGEFSKSDALHQAAEKGRLDVMRWLLDGRPSFNLYCMPLTIICLDREFPINQRELEYDIDMFNDRQSNGLGTALHAATEEGCVESMKFLIDRGIDVELPDTLGRKALTLCENEETSLELKSPV